jgi:hypothetical protein
MKWSRLPQLWTAAQRRVVLCIVVVLLAYLTYQLWRNPVDVDDPQPSHGARFDELQDRIDPNVADAATLAALPSLGEKRAKEIVAYRESFVRFNPGRLAFTTSHDLLRVKGIGTSIVANLKPYLIFGPPTATSRPTTQQLGAFAPSPGTPGEGRGGGVI